MSIGRDTPQVCVLYELLMIFLVIIGRYCFSSTYKKNAVNLLPEMQNLTGEICFSAWTVALLQLYLWVAVRSCLCCIWQHAVGQSHKPWEKQCFVHIRLQSIRFPLPPQLLPLCLSQSKGIFTERAPQPDCPTLLGAQLVVSTSVPIGQWSISLGSDETNRWMTGVSILCCKMDGSPEDTRTLITLPTSPLCSPGCSSNRCNH